MILLVIYGYVFKKGISEMTKWLLKLYEWWGRGDLNPHALRHMILSHARLPVPTLPHIREQITF